MSWSLILLAAMACNAQAQRQDPAPGPSSGDDTPQEPPHRPPPPPRNGPFQQDPERRQEPPPGEDRKRGPLDRIRHLEAEIHDLESAIENKDTPPERREKMMARLDRARAEMRELHAAMRPQDPGPANPDHRERLVKRLTDIEAMMGKVGPEDRKELQAEANKIREELKRGDFQDRFGGGPQGPPMDPEMAKRMEEMGRLDRESQELGAKLRRIPADNKDERTIVLGKLGETVSKLFDLREQMRAREVEMLKRRLEELTKMLEKRKSSRDQIIEKRIKQLSGEVDELDW